jgi:hypothetical protein
MLLIQICRRAFVVAMDGRSVTSLLPLGASWTGFLQAVLQAEPVQKPKGKGKGKGKNERKDMGQGKGKGRNKSKGEGQEKDKKKANKRKSPSKKAHGQRRSIKKKFGKAAVV